MKTLTLSFTFAFALILAALSAPFELTFTPSVSEAAGQVTGYSMWYQATNAPDANKWIWIGSCAAGQTNIVFDSSVILDTNGASINPVWFTATAGSTNNLQSYYAEPILFDTNNYPATIASANPLALAVRPLPPTFLKIVPLSTH